MGEEKLTYRFLRFGKCVYCQLAPTRQLNYQHRVPEWLICFFPNPGVPCSKPLGGSKVDSAFHPPEVDRMSTRNFWELSGKK